MKLLFRLIFPVAILVFAGSYLWDEIRNVCQFPIEYSIGAFDDRFGISREYAVSVIEDAEKVWEADLDRELFTYVEGADFLINFIYDERQRTADEENVFRELLDKKAEVNEDLEQTYSELVSRYEELETTYKTEKNVYEAKLADYNEKVDKYNSEGGAPPDVYEDLQEEQKMLQEEEAGLNAQVRRLNEYVTEINRLGEQGSVLIERYNENVTSYNQAYGESREFTQGDYRGDAINIYTFDNREELVTVLAHEFGHALSLGHVENSSSVMYYLMGEQTVPVLLTEEDKKAFVETCESGSSFLIMLRQRLVDLF